MTASRDDSETIEVVVQMPRKLLPRTGSADPGNRDHLLALAQQIFAKRQKRRTIWPKLRFKDPSWDMMLDLYIASRTARQTDITGLCLASGTATTTALRHIERMVAEGYIIRSPDLTDGRRTFLSANAALIVTIEAWLASHLQSVLSIGA